MLIIGPKNPTCNNLEHYLTLDGCSVNNFSSVRNLGVLPDSNLSFESHTSSICKTAFFHLKNIYKLRPMLSTSNTEMLIHAFMTSRLDYCNALLDGCSAQLPPHRPWDCAIDLLPGESVPKGKIYPLSLPEQNAMEEYIEEALQQGYICPSTSPAASSFFFVAKKDGGLRPCIDYQSLNNITVKFRYPLPLVPAALKHLRGATIFTKLDLRVQPHPNT